MLFVGPIIKQKLKRLLEKYVEYLWQVYSLWMALIFLAPLFTRFGWSGTGKALFALYFVLLLPIHAIIVFSLCLDDC